MKLLKITGLGSLLLVLLVGTSPVSAATSPGIGAANSFNILSSSYVNTVAGTTISSDLGYTTGPAVAPTVGGTTHVADSAYNQAGIDQGNALSALSSQPCSFNFAPGPIDLASDTTHGPVGVYTPGVYCMSGAASIGGGGTITLTGGGTYIFRMDGTLTSSANSKVVLAGGASACDVWWTPTQATTLGANSTFAGTDIDASGITIGDVVTWQGQALAFGGTVSTSRDTISSPVCAASRSATPSTPTTTPGLPNTGTGSVGTRSDLLGLLAVIVVIVAAGLYVVGKKRYSL
jgi:type VI secretion system secreted protein VgrG